MSATVPFARTPDECDRMFAEFVSGGDLDASLRTAVGGTVVQRAGKAIEIVRRNADGRWLFAIDDPFGRDPRCR